MLKKLLGLLSLSVLLVLNNPQPLLAYYGERDTHQYHQQATIPHFSHHKKQCGFGGTLFKAIMVPVYTVAGGFLGKVVGGLGGGLVGAVAGGLVAGIPTAGAGAIPGAIAGATIGGGTGLFLGNIYGLYRGFRYGWHNFRHRND